MAFKVRALQVTRARLFTPTSYRHREGEGTGKGLAYNLGDFLRRLALPNGLKHWSLRSLQVKLIKMGGRIVRHARHIIFQFAEVAVSRETFALILERINRLRPVPV